MSNNLTLWDAVRTPDPKFTKSFSRGGGFKGTATNVSYLIRMATEQWGPMGGKWGVEIVSDSYVNGAPLLIESEVVGHEIVHVIQIKLRHPDGEVPGIGQTTFVGKNKHGFFTDEEAPKKSLTDALTKAMSWLGFSADIHMGLWDDNKYVASVQARIDEPEPEKVKLITPAQVKELDALVVKADVDLSALLEWVSGKAGATIADLDSIPAAAFAGVKSSLNKTIAKKEAA